VTDPLVRQDPMEYRQLGINSQKVTHPHIAHIDVLKHIISRVRDCQPTIDGGRVGIRRHSRAPLDMLETPVIALGGGEESAQGIPQGIEGNDVRGRDGGHY
jgi:hypothetical protein